MQTEVKEIGPCKISVKVEVPKEKVKETINGKYKEFIEGSVIPGFRKGQAPQSLVERKYGKAIKEDAKMDIIRDSYMDIIKEKKLSPIMEPSIEADKITLDENAPLSFEFTLEVNPTIDLKKEKYTGVSAKKIKSGVNEKDIKDALDQLRYSSREYIPAKDSDKMEKDDLLIIDQEMILEGKTISKQENAEIAVGQEINIFTKPSAEVTNALPSIKTKESKEFNITIPADYAKKDLAGKTAKLKITVKDRKKQKLAAINDEWAKTMNFDSLEHLKKEMEKRILAEKERLAQKQLEDNIIQEILKTTDFPLPETLIEHGIENWERRHAMYLYYQGMPEDNIKAEIEKSKTTSRDNIIKSLKANFIIENIATQEKIFVIEDEVTERINLIASQTHKWPHEVKAQYEKNDLMKDLRREIREGKVRKFLREKAKLTD